MDQRLLNIPVLASVIIGPISWGSTSGGSGNARISGWSTLRESYGLLLSSKVIAFSVLMLLAAANKWRFGSQLERGDGAAASNLRRVIVVEALLICAVLAVTATMTLFYSPE